MTNYKVKKILIMFLLVFNCFNGFGQSIKDKLIGEWTEPGFSNNSLIFSSDGQGIVVLKDKVIGGDNFEVQGHKAKVLYEINDNEKPAWVDIIITVEFEGQLYRKVVFMGIVRFLTYNKIEMRFHPTKRYQSFDLEDKSYGGVFIRSK